MQNSFPGEFQRSTAGTTTKNTISIYLMGRFKIVINNCDCTHLLTYDKVKLLLAILALSQGRSITRTRVADMLWPDSQDDQGRARVRHALHTLRQAFTPAPEGLISTTTGLGLNPDMVWVDALSILNVPDQLDLSVINERLDLYTGPFLDDIKLPQSELLLSWQQSWNARLDLELSQYRSKLIAHHLDQDDTQAALNHAKLWVHQWPENEASHRLLIRLLLLSGDRDAALSAFQHCCDVLNTRLNVVPSTETRALLGLENQPLSTQSLVNQADGREPSYRPIAIVGIALAWKQPESDYNGTHEDDTVPEDALQIIDTWHERLLTLAQNHGAWLPQTLSTTMLAHFGYPSLSERPIVDAIRLAKDLAQLDTPDNIAIGLAIHADLTLMDHAQELGLNGLLCQKVVPLTWDARHGEVLLSPTAAARMADWPIETVRRTGRRYFRLNLESGPVPVARMHGRMREFDTLIQQWTRHRQGHKPITVHLTGSPGLGKSQLSHAMADYVRNVDGRVIILQSRENHHNTPLHAIHPWLRTQLELPHSLDASNWTPAQHEQAATDMQARYPLAPQACHALLDVVLNRGAALGDAYETAIDAALCALQQHDDMTRPVLIIWDDTHWNDTASNDLLQKIIASSGTPITMLICTSRKAAQPAPSVINIELTPLDATTIAEYVVHQARKTKLSRDIKTRLMSGSAGIPRYIKELLHLKSLGLPASTIPRVSDMLSAQTLRLDPNTRNLAYLAALLPQLTEHTAAEVLQLDKNTVATGLETLSSMGIIERDHSTGHARCNLIIRRSIHRLMVQRSKQTLCEQIANHLISQHTIEDKSPPSSLRAVADEWWQRIVQKAMRHSLPDQKAKHITQALIEGQYLYDTFEPERSESEDPATADMPTRTTKTPDSLPAHDTAASSGLSENPEETLAVLWGHWVIQHRQGNLSVSLHIARRIQQLAANHRHDLWQGWALYAMAQHDLWMGNPADCETLLLQALPALQQGTGLDHIGSIFDTHSYASGYASLGLAQALQGRYNTALQNTRYAIQLASQSSSSVSATICKLHLLRIHYLANNLKSLQTESTALLEHTPHGPSSQFWSAIITAHTVLPGALTQPTARAVQALKTALSLVRNTIPVSTDVYLCMLARCQIAMRNPDESIELLNEATAFGQARQSRLLSSEIHCIRGDAWVALQRPDRARQEWRKAKTIAQQHSLFAYDEWANERLAALVD